jgi:hypothetical protein
MNIKTTIQTLTILAGTLAVAAQTGLAQPSSLSITNPVLGVTNMILDVSKLTNQLQNIDLKIHRASDGNLQVEIQYPNPYTQDGRGKLAGGPNTNTVSIPSDSTQFQGIISSRGSISGNKGVAHLTFSTRASGKAEIQTGLLSAVSAGATYSVKFDAVNDLITVHHSEHASASGVGSAAEARTEVSGISTNTDLTDELGDGTWTLVLNFTNAPGVKLGGDATVTLQSGQVYPFTFTGLFSPRAGVDKLGQSKINLKGHDAGLGCILQVTLNSSNTITRIVGRVSGQTINLKQ